MKDQQHNMHSHSLWMILACVLPMGLIFILPALGVNIGAFWLLIPLFCVGSHLLMMRGHGHEDHEHPHEPHDEKKEA